MEIGHGLIVIDCHGNHLIGLGMVMGRVETVTCRGPNLVGARLLVSWSGMERCGFLGIDPSWVWVLGALNSAQPSPIIFKLY